MNFTKFVAFVLLVFLMPLSIGAQKLLKVDLSSPIKSGLGVSYEHHITKRVSFELIARNLEARSRCVPPQLLGSPCIHKFNNVGREWTIAVLSKYNFFSGNKKHDFGIGLGFIGYWYQYNQKYLDTYEKVTKRPYKEPLIPVSIFVAEYNYWVFERFSIGLQLPIVYGITSHNNELLCLNLTYKL